MRLDGLDRDEQLSGDLLVRIPPGQQAQHVALPRGQQIQLGGESAYNAFWAGISTLKLISTSTSSEDQSVRAQLELGTTDGQQRSSTQRLVVVPGPDGQWLIDIVGG